MCGFKVVQNRNGISECCLFMIKCFSQRLIGYITVRMVVSAQRNQELENVTYLLLKSSIFVVKAIL